MLLELYGVTGAERDGLIQLTREARLPGWRHSFRDVLPNPYEVYIGLEAGAASIRNFEPARVAADVPPVIRAWAHWTADRADLPKRLRRRFLSELEDDLREFPSVLATASQTPHNRYFQDLPDDVISDDPRCQRALQARHLAIPLPHDRAPGAEILDPAEPAGRARITELYLAGRGISHEQWGAYRAVAENLWSGDQPKLAEQALRMAAEGLSRDVILDKLVQDG